MAICYCIRPHGTNSLFSGSGQNVTGLQVARFLICCVTLEQAPALSGLALHVRQVGTHCVSGPAPGPQPPWPLFACRLRKSLPFSTVSCWKQ